MVVGTPSKIYDPFVAVQWSPMRSSDWLELQQLQSKAHPLRHIIGSLQLVRVLVLIAQIGYSVILNVNCRCYFQLEGHHAASSRSSPAGLHDDRKRSGSRTKAVIVVGVTTGQSRVRVGGLQACSQGTMTDSEGTNSALSIASAPRPRQKKTIPSHQANRASLNADVGQYSFEMAQHCKRH